MDRGRGRWRRRRHGFGHLPCTALRTIPSLIGNLCPAFMAILHWYPQNELRERLAAERTKLSPSRNVLLAKGACWRLVTPHLCNGTTTAHAVLVPGMNLRSALRAFVRKHRHLCHRATCRLPYPLRLQCFSRLIHLGLKHISALYNGGLLRLGLRNLSLRALNLVPEMLNFLVGIRQVKLDSSLPGLRHLQFGLSHCSSYSGFGCLDKSLTLDRRLDNIVRLQQ